MLQEILSRALQYNPNLDVVLIQKAYDLAGLVHDGQRRLDGADYIEHPLAVMKHVIDVKVDSATIAAALLHDVLDYEGISRLDIVEHVNEEVAELVDGVARIKRLRTRSGTKDAHEKTWNLILVAGRDVRVVLIRLAEKLHNLETSSALDSQRRQVLINKALAVYAPIAERLGLFEYKRSFENVSLKYLEPEIYNQIEDYFSNTEVERERFVDDIAGLLSQVLKSNQIEAEVFGRVKHHYSIFRKFQTDTKRRRSDDTITDYLHRLHDVYAFTVLVGSVEECYKALDVIHRNWKQDKDEFDDYIVAPKPNGYSSIQTAIYWSDLERIEVQIRTHEMHQVNEFGPAAHLYYKEIGREKGSLKVVPEKKIAMLKGLMQWQEKIQSGQRNADELQIKAFSDRVFVFTPKGDIKDLPSGATPIDFAYAVHTEVGDNLVRVKVNGKLVPLSYELQNGDVCEIMTGNRPDGPSRDWLNIAKTGFALSKIRQQLKHIMPYSD